MNAVAAWLAAYPASLSHRSLVMGILNASPDSFSEDRSVVSPSGLRDKALALIEQGADIIDIGGESTRPGATPVSVDCELARVIPLIEAIVAVSDCCLSIDTYKPEVMRAAIAAGAHWVNDIYALRMPFAMQTVRDLQVPVCLMHMQGTPQTMQSNPLYPGGVVSDVMNFFTERLAACAEVGINPQQIILDPGIGFGKNTQNNLCLIREIKRLTYFGRPCLLGVSRKSMIGAIVNKAIADRSAAGLALAVYASLQGVAIIRTHDVAETVDALRILQAVQDGHLKESAHERTTIFWN